jgi:hypothetical protein
MNSLSLRLSVHRVPGQIESSSTPQYTRYSARRDNHVANDLSEHLPMLPHMPSTEERVYMQSQLAPSPSQWTWGIVYQIHHDLALRHGEESAS